MSAATRWPEGTQVTYMANECLLGDNRKGVRISMSNTYGWVGEEMNEFIYVTVWAKTSLVHTSDFAQLSGSKIL